MLSAIELNSGYFSENSEPPKLIFQQNTIEITDRPMTILFAPEFNVKLTKLYFIEPLLCANLKYLKTNDFLLNHADNIFFTTFDRKHSQNEIDDTYRTFSYILNSQCINESYVMYAIIGSVSAVLILIAVAIVLFILYWRKRKAEQQLNVIQPEGRTYRETQIVMQIENAGLLKTDL